MPVPDFSVGEVFTASAADSIGLWLIKSDTLTNIGTTPVSIGTVFSSSYRNYRLVIQINNTSGALTLSIRLGTTTGNYFGNVSCVDFTGVGSNIQTNGIGEWNIFRSNSSMQYGAISMDITNPQVAAITSAHGTSIQNEGSGVATGSMGFIQNSTTQFTQMSFLTSTGTVDLRYRIYGYRD